MINTYFLHREAFKSAMYEKQTYSKTQSSNMHYGEDCWIQKKFTKKFTASISRLIIQDVQQGDI